MSESTDTSSSALRYVTSFLRFLVHCWAGICLFLLASQSGLLEATGLGPGSPSSRPVIGLFGPLVGGFALSVAIGRQIDKIERSRVRALALGLGLPVGYAATWFGTVTLVVVAGGGSPALRAAPPDIHRTAVNVEIARWPIPTGAQVDFDQYTLGRLEAQYRRQLPERILARIRSSWPEGPRHEVAVASSFATYTGVATNTRLAVVRMVLRIRANDRTVAMVHAGVISGVDRQEFLQVVCTGGPSLDIFRQPCRNSVEETFGIENPSLWTKPADWPF